MMLILLKSLAFMLMQKTRFPVNVVVKSNQDMENQFYLEHVTTNDIISSRKPVMISF